MQDPATNPVYTMPFNSKDAIKNAIATEISQIGAVRTQVLAKMTEYSMTPTSDPNIAAHYDQLNQTLESSRKATVKGVINSVSDNLLAIGYRLSPDTILPTLPPCTLYDMTGLPHKEHVDNALDWQCSELSTISTQIIDTLEITETTTSIDPRITEIFNTLNIGDENQRRAELKKFLAVIADNIHTITIKWT
jgi:hypothetical protein